MKFTDNFINFQSPLEVLCMYDESFINGAISPHPWQTKILEEFSQPLDPEDVLKIALIAANGSGKSQFILASCALWLAIDFDDALSYITSSSASQLDTQTERYLVKLAEAMNRFHREQLKEDVWDIIKRKLYFKPTRSFIDLFATDEPKRAEGKHPLVPNGEFGIFVDEGKSITEDIYDAIARCHGFTRRLDISSPGGCRGHFYDISTNNKSSLDSKVNDLGWRVHKVTAFDCPHIRKKEIEGMIAKHGLHDPLVRSSIFAEFTSVDEKTVISYEILKDCLKFFTNARKFGKLRAGLDLSAGGDEMVMSIWHGNINIAQEVARFKDTSQGVKEIIHWIQKWKLPIIDDDYYNIFADDGGVGRGILDNLREKGYKIHRILNQSRPYDPTRYSNRGTELWFNFKRFVEDYQVKFIDDSQLISQLGNRYYKLQPSTNKLILEGKEEARKKGHPSPDRADACILAWSNITYPCLEISGSVKVNKIAGVDIKELENIMRSRAIQPSLRSNDEFKEFDGVVTQARLVDNYLEAESTRYGDLNHLLHKTRSRRALNNEGYRIVDNRKT